MGENESEHKWIIDQLLYTRKNFAYGSQVSYFDSPNVIAIYRTGRENDINTGCIAVLSNSDEEGEKVVEAGQNRTGQTWKEITGSGFENVVIDENGFGTFKVQAGKISVWVPETE